MPSTRPYIPRVAVVFDFDKTLATSSIDAILELYEVGREAWDRDHDAALGEGWDDIIRRGQALIDLGQRCGRPLTMDMLHESAGHVRLFDGVLEMPEQMRAVAHEIHPGLEVEFTILSSGYAEIINATEVRSSTAPSPRPSTSMRTAGRSASSGSSVTPRKRSISRRSARASTSAAQTRRSRRGATSTSTTGTSFSTR